MMDVLGLRTLVAGAVAYQAVVMAGLVWWLWKRGIQAPAGLDIGRETPAERKKMIGVVALFWMSAIAIIVGTW